ncbi:MAG: hypothetical protein M0C28_06765 [Candidatus Moduliflexus flocculans]|nr:hypothetical protein [Candidatus Moduliflexus flocculans]
MTAGTGNDWLLGDAGSDTLKVERAPTACMARMATTCCAAATGMTTTLIGSPYGGALEPASTAVPATTCSMAARAATISTPAPASTRSSAGRAPTH